MSNGNRVMVMRALRQVAGVLLFMSGTAAIAAALNPVPLIYEPLLPDSAKPGGAAFTLTINGFGFVSGAVVRWNGSARTTTFVSQTQLKASILASDIAKGGTASITVANPVPGGGTSNAAFFPVTHTAPSLVLSTQTELDAQFSFPDSIAVGDFNGDGKLDIAATENSPTSSVHVFLGNGDGTFQSPLDSSVSAGPATVADINNDGKLDLVVINGDVSVLLGNGDGTFQAPLNYPLGSGYVWVTVGDFNGDGKLDLAVANYTGSYVSVFLGNGDGTFKAAVNYATGPYPESAAVGDFNGDGKLDLVTADYPGGNVSVLLGNGDGTFKPAVNYATGSGSNSVAVGDFNGDGKLDIVTANEAANTVSVLLGNGDGTFQAAVDYDTDLGTMSVALGDFNGDGKLDLVTANNPGDDVSVLLGDGDGTFQAHQDFGVLSQPYGIAVGDFNGDGRLDIAANASSVAIQFQIPTVTLSKASLTFANQLVGAGSASQTVTLTNTSSLTLNIATIAVTGANPTDFVQTHTCGSGLGSGATCTISVTFKPTQVGPRTSSVTITDNALTSPQSVVLSGTGVVAGPNVTLSTNSLAYATQTMGTISSPQSVTLSNYGTAALSLTSMKFTGADPGDFAQTNTCGSSIAPGTSCTVNVTFDPAQIGARTANLSVTDNAPGSPQTVRVMGVGTAVQLNPASLNFGIVPVGTSKTASTTLTNAGSTALSITGIAIAGADTDEFGQTNTCGTGLGAGRSCAITISFTPKEKGSDSAEVSISDNGGGSPQQVSLSGTGCVWRMLRQRKCLTTASAAVQGTLAKSRSATVPSVTGASRVGTRIIDLVDSSRIDPFATDGLNRELLVRFWYPASAEQGCKLADYTSPGVWNYFAELTGQPLPAVITNSCLDAPIADEEHPVIVFTHGYTGTFTDYTFLFEDLASRGYVVVSIDHTHEATAVEFPDERLVKSLVGSHLTNTWQTDEQTMSSALSVRLDDLKFVVDELERLNTSTGTAFAGRFDLSRLALAGHSLGGLTTWLGVQRDARFKAAVMLDPYLPDTPGGSTETPIMLLTMGREQPNEDECQLWSDLRGPRVAVNLGGAEHVTPSDLVWLAKGAVKTGPMGTEKTIDALRNYIAAFLDTNLRGMALDPLLKGSSPEFPEVAVTTQDQQVCGQP